jgi:hypothetical protein
MQTKLDHSLTTINGKKIIVWKQLGENSCVPAILNGALHYRPFEKERDVNQKPGLHLCAR